MRLTEYSGERYIWTLAQAAQAAAMFPHYPPTWEGLEALQARVEMMGEPIPDDAPKNFQWARTAFADAAARFAPRYEEVCA